MKLDFLKDGLINTANFIPAYAVGEINTNPVVLTVNIIGRILALYLCFQYNADLEPKSLVIALLFPTLYIIYIIAVKGIDSVLEKFDLETTDFTEMFDSDEGKCVERKGPDGDMKSVPKDKKRCENVEGNLYNSKILCESITDSEDTNSARAKKRNDAGVCKYISKKSDIRRCRDFEYEQNCTGSGFGCEWNSYSNYTSEQKKEICSNHENSKLAECPEICPYYQEGNVSFNVLKGSGQMNSISLAKGFKPNPIYQSGSPLADEKVKPVTGMNEVPTISSGSSSSADHQRKWVFKINASTSSTDVFEPPSNFTEPLAPSNDITSIAANQVYAGGDGLTIPGSSSSRKPDSIYFASASDNGLINGFPLKKPETDRKFDNELIALSFDASSRENTFGPLMSTDYRGKDVQIRVTSGDDDTIKVITGKVRLIIEENYFETTAGCSVTNYGMNAKNNIYSTAQFIGGEKRKGGKYVVIIQPNYNPLMDFYNDIDLSTTATKDTLENKLIFANNIKVVISNGSSSCGKLYLNDNFENDPMGVNDKFSYLGTPVPPTDASTIYTETIGGLAWSGQKGGMCINPE